VRAAVVDTNVLAAANGSTAQASPSCVKACIAQLRAIKAGVILVLDDQRRIIREYE